ncbi:Methyl-accepting chemotaxis protein I (serine chemoreceptor protein) [Halomonas citrativorans]|uniref:Methyl-accepting chemotaxis protein I (Serine chemoreceptor protein) n=1 Tax=Halomonas citrativorans TaxID=2742612 RepID=A0A1R4I1M5_9GAMM|nr:Methyl-accepting chemotaxis protein I (serine chemoreceptor protein) [Halomonas citrativorans]
MTQMDQMTQQNAGLVQESNHATQMLAQLSTQLRERVSHFRVDRQSTLTPLPSRSTHDDSDF